MQNAQTFRKQLDGKKINDRNKNNKIIGQQLSFAPAYFCKLLSVNGIIFRFLSLVTIILT